MYNPFITKQQLIDHVKDAICTANPIIKEIQYFNISNSYSIIVIQDTVKDRKEVLKIANSVDDLHPVNVPYKGVNINFDFSERASKFITGKTLFLSWNACITLGLKHKTGSGFECKIIKEEHDKNQVVIELQSNENPNNFGDNKFGFVVSPDKSNYWEAKIHYLRHPEILLVD